MSSFLHLVEELLREPGERAAFLDDPNGYLPSRGFEEFSADDVELSLQLVSDSLPPALAQRIDPSAGLNTVTDIDIDEIPGLWAPPSDGLDDLGGLEDLAMEDPFFDDLEVDELNTVDGADGDLEGQVDTSSPDESSPEDSPVVEDLFGETSLPDQAPRAAFEDADLTDLTDLNANFDVAFDEIDSDSGLGVDDSVATELDALGEFGNPEIDDFDGLDS